eukprot:CAMPEP_0185268794 /NCGR_PEP_ID=MMETSP1359-20130426/38011_1 /TAXON_ID=552665 /ORGANISM="Bigelowiella longifila, Strain CCMP242" /LENGTH=145 /DNA_ID=CAMNT_0027859685 /DNA_START=212 /DNA_END=649 /DNA_ORIENTATION=-
MRIKSAESMKTKTFKFHIYVTSAPKDLSEEKEFAGLDSSEKSDPNFWGIPAPESKVIVERASFSKMDLYKALLAPKKEQQLGDICIYSGRPKWDPRFEEISKLHRGEKVGVMFCGNRFVAAALKDACRKHSEAGPTSFTLHKENF